MWRRSSERFRETRTSLETRVEVIGEHLIPERSFAAEARSGIKARMCRMIHFGESTLFV